MQNFTNPEAATMLRKFKFNDEQSAALQIAANFGYVLLNSEEMAIFGQPFEGNETYRCKFVFRGGKKRKQDILVMPIEQWS
jgi:hypothetical protein